MVALERLEKGWIKTEVNGMIGVIPDFITNLNEKKEYEIDKNYLEENQQVINIFKIFFFYFL